MSNSMYIERMVDLLDADSNQILNMSVDEAITAVGSGDIERVRQIDGHFALVHKSGQYVRLARSLGRPMRFFLAKRAEGPCLVIAERIDEIFQFLKTEGLDDQFHPSYTRMVPAHHILELHLIGCPDPNPRLSRYFAPKRNQFPNDIHSIGKAYLEQVMEECDRWLMTLDDREPIGVAFSGGIDSGAVFLVLHHLLMKKGTPQRLKAFTLSVDDEGLDSSQACQFLNELDLDVFLEAISVPASQIDYREAIRVIEDYKPLDVQSAAMALALCRGIRQEYPNWKWLVDGDGGDENLKDYPIEDNPELTIRSVLSNSMLYQEGWGVDAVKHSLTYSGGQSRGHVRSWAPARQYGFKGFSPFALPNVIEVAEGIPFIELTNWNHERLYALKGEVVRSGVKSIIGVDMPVFEKRRFQHGATSGSTFDALFPKSESAYRSEFAGLYG